MWEKRDVPVDYTDSAKQKSSANKISNTLLTNDKPIRWLMFTTDLRSEPDVTQFTHEPSPRPCQA